MRGMSTVIPALSLARGKDIEEIEKSPQSTRREEMRPAWARRGEIGSTGNRGRHVP